MRILLLLALIPASLCAYRFDPFYRAYSTAGTGTVGYGDQGIWSSALINKSFYFPGAIGIIVETATATMNVCNTPLLLLAPRNGEACAAASHPTRRDTPYGLAYIGININFAANPGGDQFTNTVDLVALATYGESIYDLNEDLYPGSEQFVASSYPAAFNYDLDFEVTGVAVYEDMANTPEPQYYAALGIGLSAVLIVRRYRR